MGPNRRLFGGVLLLAPLLMIGSAGAATLDDLNLGDHWMGERWDKDSLKERTVVIEFWGYNCPPCIAGIPHLIDLQKKHRARGLILIGIHCQNVPKEKVLALCRGRKINYSIYGSGKIKGCEFSGIPKAFLINWKGEVCWDGHPASGMDSAIEDALRGTPDWLVGPRKYVKVKAEAGKVRKRKGMGAAAKALREKVKSDDPLEKEEVEELLGRLVKYAERMMGKAEILAGSGDPSRAREIWKKLAKDFRGDEIGEKAAAVEKEKSKDSTFKRELSAAKMLGGIEKMADRIDPPRRGEDLSKWRRKNAGMLNRILATYKNLKKKYGDTKVCDRARELLKSLQLE